MLAVAVFKQCFDTVMRGVLLTFCPIFLTFCPSLFVGISFEKPASTLKHLLKSSIDFMHTILKWLQSNSEEQFHMIQINAITAFVNLVTNSIVDHVSDAANQILEITIGSSDSERLQEILHSHLLSLCFFVVDEEINRVDRFAPLVISTNVWPFLYYSAIVSRHKTIHPEFCRHD